MTHTNFNKSTVCKSNPTGNSGDGKQRKDQEREQKTEQRREQLTWRREKINVVAETARERTGVDLGRARGRRKRDYLSLMANLLTATLFTTSIYTSNITIYPPHTHTHTHTHTLPLLLQGLSGLAVSLLHSSGGFQTIFFFCSSEPETSPPETTSAFCSQLVCRHHITCSIPFFHIKLTFCH